ncbi:MAG: hypothetical protein AB7O44_32310 [Hyphomicrobiaceae bacterium]
MAGYIDGLPGDDCEDIAICRGPLPFWRNEQAPFLLDSDEGLAEMRGLIDTARDALMQMSALTPDQQQSMWLAWRTSRECCDLIPKMATGDVGFSDALEVAFRAALEAVAKV